MPIKPIVIPATQQVSYDLPRVCSLSILQDGYGKPLQCQAQIRFARLLQDGVTYEDAPLDTVATVTARVGIATLKADHPEVYAAMLTINQFAATLGVQQGVLQME